MARSRYYAVPQLCGRFLAVCLVTGTLAVAPASSARAACTGAIVYDTTTAMYNNMEDIVLLTSTVGQSFTAVIDALTLWANQGTNNTQHKSNMEAVESDKEVAQVSASATATNRTQNAVDFTPSKVVCAAATSQNNVAKTAQGVQDALDISQKKYLERSTNVSGDTEKGTLFALNKVFQNRCSKYADPDVVQNNSICAGTTDAKMKDRDIQPFKAILDPIILEGDYHTAALDAITMLTEPAPTDPLRGAALSRVVGQNMYMLKMRDTARMNLARGVLEDMVARRYATSSSGPSRMSRYVEMVTGETVSGSSGSATLTEVTSPAAGAEEAENAAVQTVAARLATQQALIYEIMRVTEQMLMVDAVNLAIRVENSGEGASRLSVRSAN